jgi:hypothetical protein
MVWLTDEERAENARRDEQARRDGYRDSYDRQQSNYTQGVRERLRNISQADIQTVLEAKRLGLL